MRASRLVLLLAAPVLAGCGGPAGPAAEMVLRVDGPVASLDAVADVVNERLDRLDAGRAEPVPGDPPRIRCLVDAPWNLEPDAVEQVVTHAGTLEMRIVVPERQAAAERAVREQAGAAYAPTDPAYRWVASADPGGADWLVLAPEQPLVRAIREAVALEGPQARDRMDGLRADLDTVRAAEVFGEKDIALARVERSQGSPVVYFEMRPERTDAFAEFTGRHAGRQLAIVLDGRVHSAPLLASRLPGRGVIEGGSGGFTEREAQVLAAVLSVGRALPVRLVRESFGPLR